MAKKKSKSSKQKKPAATTKSPFVHSLSGLDQDLGSDSSSARQPTIGGLDGDIRRGARLSTRTGRMMVVSLNKTSKTSVKSMLATIKNLTGLGATSSRVCRASDFKEKPISESDANSAEVVLFENFGIAILNNDASQKRAIRSALARSSTSDKGLVVEAERVNYTLGHPSPARQATPLSIPPGVFPSSPDFQAQAQFAAANFVDTADSTWGLKACNVVNSSLSGAGIKIGIVDSGFDLGHPDFAGRNLETFVNVPSQLQVEDSSGNPVTIPQVDSSVHDIVGHGTHCAGTACGPRVSSFGPRYGVAYGSNLFVAKVMFHHPFEATGVGFDLHILDGIRAALEAGCRIISLSLGSTREPGDPPFSTAYENAAEAALHAGSLLVAATGNGSRRSYGIVNEVGGPANCPSVAGVAAVDSRLIVADFSNGRANNFNAGAEVNFCAPGVQVLSSLPIQPSSFSVPNRRTDTFAARWDGTSMATPHVSGIAALVAQQTEFVGLELYRELRSRARNAGPQDDYGHGLAQV